MSRQRSRGERERERERRAGKGSQTASRLPHLWGERDTFVVIAFLPLFIPTLGVSLVDEEKVVKENKEENNNNNWV